MKRIGTVLTFKSGVTRVEAARALRSIGSLLDTPTATPVPRYFTNDEGRKCVSYDTKSFRHNDLLNNFDDDWGGPVWYIP
jgi:hypothetical protein